MYEKILLATDGSENAIRAAQKAIEMHKEFNSKIIAFHALEYHYIPRRIPLFIPYEYNYSYQMPKNDYQNLYSTYYKAGKRVIDETKSLFESYEVPLDARLIEELPPGDYAKTVAEKENIDLLIAGCTGHSKVKRVLLGTTANKFVNEMPCEVLIVR